MKRYKVKRRELPLFCPKCKSEKLWHAGPEANITHLTDPVQCEDCGFTWCEIWRFQKWVPTGKYAEYPSNNGKEAHGQQ